MMTTVEQGRSEFEITEIDCDNKKEQYYNKLNPRMDTSTEILNGKSLIYSMQLEDGRMKTGYSNDKDYNLKRSSSTCSDNIGYGQGDYVSETSSSSDNLTVRLNICGTLFEVQLKTLKRFPDTRLGRMAHLLHSDESYRLETDDYYFDRNPNTFSDILQYYRSGELHIDQVSCGSVFMEEMQFWGLEPKEISLCCWSKFNDYRSTTKMYKELDDLFDDGTSLVTSPKSTNCMSKLRFYIYHTLETPSFSIMAKVFVFISVVITLVSIFGFIAETHYLFQQLRLHNGTLIPAPAPAPTVITPASCCCQSQSVSVNETESDDHHDDHDDHAGGEGEDEDAHYDSHIILHYIDFFTFGYFIFEIFTRLLFSYNKKKFMKNAFNLIDVVCILAHFIGIIEHTVTVDTNASTVHEQSLALVFILKSLRIMRIARVFKLFRHMTGFKILIYTIVVSSSELLLIVSFLFAGVMLFASIMFFVEEETFPNIPYAIWWALVTMTTVGYGDVTPKSNGGYFIGALCVVSGVLVIAFTVPVVVNNFTLYYALCKSGNARLKLLEEESLEDADQSTSISSCYCRRNSKEIQMSDKERKKPNSKENGKY